MSGDPDLDPYTRGRAAGEVSMRLAQHDQHFAALNGNLKEMAVQMHGLSLGIQHLSDQFIANEAKVVATAAALELQNKARRDATDERVRPLTILVMGFAIVSAMLNLYQFIIHAHN